MKIDMIPLEMIFYVLDTFVARPFIFKLKRFRDFVYEDQKKKNSVT